MAEYFDLPDRYPKLSAPRNDKQKGSEVLLRLSPQHGLRVTPILAKKWLNLLIWS